METLIWYLHHSIDAFNFLTWTLSSKYSSGEAILKDCRGDFIVFEDCLSTLLRGNGRSFVIGLEEFVCQPEVKCYMCRISFLDPCVTTSLHP